MPVFDTLTVCVESLFRITLPKVAAEGVMVNARVPPPEPPTRPHPESDSPAANIAMEIARLG